MTIRPLPKRDRSLAWPVAFGVAAVLVVAVGSGLGASLAIEARAARNQPVAIAAPLCPAASTERRP